MLAMRQQGDQVILAQQEGVEYCCLRQFVVQMIQRQNVDPNNLQQLYRLTHGFHPRHFLALQMVLLGSHYYIDPEYAEVLAEILKLDQVERQEMQVMSQWQKSRPGNAQARKCRCMDQTVQRWLSGGQTKTLE